MQISNRFKHVVAALIERIENNEEDSDLLACVRTILVLAGTIKGVVGGAAAEQLLPLLVNGITVSIFILICSKLMFSQA